MMNYIVGSNGTSSGITLGDGNPTNVDNAAGALDPGPTGAVASGYTFTGTSTTGIILSNPTTQNPLTVASGALVYSNSPTANAAAVLGTSGYPWTVTNLGVIESVGSLGSGVYLESGGVVTNGTSGAAGAQLGGGYRGVLINGAVGAVDNFATIAGVGASGRGIVLAAGGAVSNEPGGFIAGAKNGVYLRRSTAAVAPTLSNQGTIASLGSLVVNGTAQAGVAADVATGSAVQNGPSGLIEAYYIGIRVGFAGDPAAAATIVNFGTIDIVEQSSTLPFGIGIQVRTQSSVINFGTVMGTGLGGGVGVQLPAGGFVQNGTNGATTALIENYTHAVGAGYSATTTVVNFGTLEATGSGVARKDAGNAIVIHYNGIIANYGLVQSQVRGIWTNVNPSFAGTSTVTNTGTIASRGLYQSGVLYPQGVYLAGGGLLINGQSGSSAGLISAQWNGVLVTHHAATIENFGTIQSLATTLSNPGGFAAKAINLTAGGLIVNGASGATGALIEAYEAPVYIGGYRSIITPGAIGTVVNFGTIAGNGTGSIANSSIALVSGGTVVNYGLIASAGSRGVSLGQTAATIFNFGTISALGGTAISLGAVGNDLVVLGSISSLQGVVGNLVAGDAFDLPFLTFSNSGTATLGANNVLQVVEPGGTFSIALDPSQSFAGYVFNTSADGSGGTLVTEAANPCFCRGTLILTERGEVAVEDLAIGDRVVTLTGRLEPIKWIGRRAYDGRFIAGNRVVLPVRIAAGALSDGLPARDLWLSPEHALYLDGLLVAAGLLLNGATICQAERVDRLEYFHIELEDHDVILAEGAPVESYVECDNRGVFHNAGEFAVLYPGDRRQRRFCAPRLEAGDEQLAAIRVAVGSRAAAGVTEVSQVRAMGSGGAG